MPSWPTHQNATPTADHPADWALARRAGLGDRDAFGIIVTRYGPALYRFVSRLLDAPTDVEDAMQETFLDAWKGLPGFRGDSSVQTWLFTLARRRAYAYYKRLPASGSRPHVSLAHPGGVAVTIHHDDDILGQATQLLRQHTDAGWTAISADILHRALHAFRPSEPVRGRHDLGDFFVAADVVVARLRRAVDAVEHAAAARITCTTDGDQRLATVTIQIVAAYGTNLLALSDRVHQTVAGTLAEELGALAPPAEAIHAHVHIGDVTDDPRDVR